MKQHILPAIKLTVLCIILFTVIYPASVWAIAQVSDNKGKGEIIEHNGKTYYANIGQSFTGEKYFNSRPSAVDYNAAGSAGSNKGPSNEEHLKQVQARIDTILMKNPGIKKSEIPADLVTASGSGLDPDFSVQAAKIQVKRIAEVRNIDEAKINNLIAQHTEKPLLGMFGPEKINVLKLNIALDRLNGK
nr:K(+)-transporting ATPase subunit C [uncultured Chryseobacterium sp.]